MSWRQKLSWAPGQRGKASFRGAPFYVDFTDTSIGRKTETHYVQGKGEDNDVWTQDLGSEPDTFTVSGYVIQNLANGYDHFPERDKLISALKTRNTDKNVGVLIHPFYGKIDVCLVGTASISEGLQGDCGIARFSMTFQQYKKPIFKQQKKDDIATVDTSMLGMVNAALDSFTDFMYMAGSYTSSLTAPITGVMNKTMNAINSVNGAVSSTVNDALNTVNTAIATIDSVLDAPCTLANTILGAADAVKGIVGMAGEVVQGGIIGGCSGQLRGSQTVMDGSTVPANIGERLVKSLSIGSIYESSDLGSVSDEQSNNLELVANVGQTSMLSNACGIAIRIEYTSQDQMLSTMQSVTDGLDNLIDRLGSQTDINDELLFQQVQKLRADFITSMLSKYSDLAKEYDYKVSNDVENSLVLAFKKYGDIDRADDIFNRNRSQVRHPAFLPSGNTIRLLST